MELNEHYLLTAIGVKPTESTYILDGKKSNGSFSASALMKVLDDKPGKILLLLTEKSKGKAYIQFKKEVGDIEICEIEIPNGTNAQEIQQIIRTVLDNIPENSDLTMDISNGLRHFPFLFFTSALYIQSFKNVDIKGVYYGMFEEKDEFGNCQFIDLKVLLNMVYWFHAVKNFTDEKRANLLADMLSKTVNREKDLLGTHAVGALKGLIKQMKRLEEYYGAGLPLGLGDSSKSIIDQLEKKKEKFKDMNKSSIPLFSDLMEYVSSSLMDFKLSNEITTTKEWKSKLKIDMNEIIRQSNIIDSYLETGHYVNAIRLIREWIVNRCILSSKGNIDKWVDRKVRMPVERQLGSISWRLRKDILDDEKKELAYLWDSVSELRNEIAHTGMKEDSIKLEERLKTTRKTWERMKSMIDDNEFWSPYDKRGNGKLLITPLGLSKGLLFSALKLIEPDICLIVTSEKAKSTIDEIIKRSDFQGELLDPIVLQDPHTGFDEIRTLLASIIPDKAEIFLDVDEIIVNITGGTTTMQVLIDEITKQTERMGKHPKRVVIMDKRPIFEQKEEPYVVGRLIKLDDIIPKEGVDGVKNG